MKKLILTLFLSAGLLYSQTSEIKGIVYDSDTGKPLPYASILLDGTTRGTVSNLDGNFAFKLEPGRYTLITRYVGYKTDTVYAAVPQKERTVIKLIKQPVLLPEVVVTSEDPAYRIIREAIRRKRINRAGLEHFEYNAYSKNIIKSSDEIATIEESFIKGYNKPDSWEKEFILKTHRTENIKKNRHTMNAMSDFTKKYLLDFSADTLTLLMSKVYLPIADNALDYYDYKLINIIKTNAAPIYVIKVIPRSVIQPLVEGTIYIEGENYSLTKVDLKASEGLRFPYIHDLDLRFKQSLSRYGGYWLPDYVEMDASFSLNFGGLIGFDKMSFQTVNSITEYKINQPIPDSVLHAVKSWFGGFASDTAQARRAPAELTDADIKNLRPIPLSNSEKEAFATLDSSMTLEKQIKFTGALAGMVNRQRDTSRSAFSKILSGGMDLLTNYVYLDNNRTGYVSLGGRYNSNFFSNSMYLNGYAGYSFGLKKPVASLMIGYRPQEFFIGAADIEIFRTLKPWQEFTPYSGLMNSAAVFFGYEDQYNYYLSTGFKIGLSKRINRKTAIALNFISDNQSSVKEDKYLTIVKTKRIVRPNPAINEGFDRKLELLLRLGQSPYELQVIPDNALLADVQLSRYDFKSSFNYFKMLIAGQLKLKTFYPELFVSPFLLLNLEAGYIRGDYGVQHLFSPAAAMGFYSPVTSFQGLKPYRFAGDKMIAFHAEHNWRTIIFQALGLNFLTDLDLDIVTGGSVLRIFNDSSYLPRLTQRKAYWEVYAGISRILAILKLNVYYNSFKSFGATLSTAVIF